MARTLAEINEEIARLQKEAERVRAEEVAGVIERIKEAIAHYGLTPRDLGFGGTGRKQANARTPVPNKRAKKTVPSAVKYRDDAGNTWVGRGKRPDWFKAALAAGKRPEDFEVQ
jgi:DNA-binding protein H-NS